MILVPYLLVGIYLFKVARERKHAPARVVAIGASAYGVWLLYASGPLHLLLSVVLYAPGIALFLFARRGGRATQSLNRAEKSMMVALVLAALPAAWLLAR